MYGTLKIIHKLLIVKKLHYDSQFQAYNNNDTQLDNLVNNVKSTFLEIQKKITFLFRSIIL